MWGAVPLHPVDLGCGFQARSLRRRVGATGYDGFARRRPRGQQALAHGFAVRMREIDVRHRLARAREERRMATMRIVDDLIGYRKRARRKIIAYAADGRHRDHVRHACRVQRPDIGAVVHLVRRNHVAVPVARQKHHLAAADDPKSRGPEGSPCGVRTASSRSTVRLASCAQAAAADDCQHRQGSASGVGRDA
jgi:hypothetical protein